MRSGEEATGKFGRRGIWGGDGRAGELNELTGVGAEGRGREDGEGDGEGERLEEVAAQLEVTDGTQEQEEVQAQAREPSVTGETVAGPAVELPVGSRGWIVELAARRLISGLLALLSSVRGLPVEEVGGEPVGVEIPRRSERRGVELSATGAEGAGKLVDSDWLKLLFRLARPLLRRTGDVVEADMLFDRLFTGR